MLLFRIHMCMVITLSLVFQHKDDDCFVNLAFSAERLVSLSPKIACNFIINDTLASVTGIYCVTKQMIIPFPVSFLSQGISFIHSFDLFWNASSLKASICKHSWKEPKNPLGPTFHGLYFSSDNLFSVRYRQTCSMLKIVKFMFLSTLNTRIMMFLLPFGYAYCSAS